eukprot:5736_1
MSKFEPFVSLHPYGKQLIATYFNNKKSLNINYSMLKKQYRFIFDLIYCSEHEGIKINIMDSLFPNIENIQIKTINFCDQTMNNTLQVLIDNIAPTLNIITIISDVNSDKNVIQLLEFYSKRFQKEGFKLSINHEQNNIIYIRRLNIDQLTMNHNNEDNHKVIESEQNGENVETTILDSPLDPEILLH